MRAIYRIAAVSIVASMSANQLQAASTLQGPIRQLLEASLDQEHFRTPPGRTALVKAAQAYCREIDRVYPRNSPSENAWLDNETKASTERGMRALSSPEFGRRAAQWFVEGCNIYADRYLKGTDKSRSLVGLAYSYLRFERSGAIEAAERNGISKDDLLIVGTAAEALILSALMEDDSVK